MVGPQDVHGSDQHRAAVARTGRDAVARHRERAVRVLHADGPQHRAGHRPVHIVQRRSLRAQAQGFAHVRAKRVLLRWLLLGRHAVRHHQELEGDAALRRHRAHAQLSRARHGKQSPSYVARRRCVSGIARRVRGGGGEKFWSARFIKLISSTIPSFPKAVGRQLRTIQVRNVT